MPAKFDACVKGGGRVRRVSGPSKEFNLAAGEYINVCFPKGGGPMVRGETHTKESSKEKAPTK